MQKTWFATYQKNKNDRIFLVFYDSIPVGCISVIHRKNEIEIGRVMLGEKNYARKGIMGQALEQIVTANKNKKIFIEVLKNNIAGVNFYKKHGFAIIQNTEECYRMERK